MSDTEITDRWDETRRRQLFDRYSKRSDEAANFLRTALFALATVAGGALVNKFYEGPFNAHYISILFFVLAIGLIVYSWDFQKRKSLQRIGELEQDNWQKSFSALQVKISASKKNQTIDRWAAGMIIAGFAAEFVIKATVLSCR